MNFEKAFTIHIQYFKRFSFFNTTKDQKLECFLLKSRQVSEERLEHLLEKTLKAFTSYAAAGLARHDGLMHAAKSMKNGSEWDGPFDLFNRYISRENMKEYDGPNRCYSSTTAVVPEAHVIVLCKNIFFSRYF